MIQLVRRRQQSCLEGSSRGSSGTVLVRLGRAACCGVVLAVAASVVVAPARASDWAWAPHRLADFTPDTNIDHDLGYNGVLINDTGTRAVVTWQQTATMSSGVAIWDGSSWTKAPFGAPTAAPSEAWVTGVGLSTAGDRAAVLHYGHADGDLGAPSVVSLSTWHTGSWSAPLGLSNAANIGVGEGLWMSGDGGTVIARWSEQDLDTHESSEHLGRWHDGTLTQITPPPAGLYVQAVSTDGQTILAVGVVGSAVAVSRWQGGTWSTPTTIATGATYVDPQFAVSADTTRVVALWSAEDDNGHDTGQGLAVWAAAAGWSNLTLPGPTGARWYMGPGSRDARQVAFHRYGNSDEMVTTVLDGNTWGSVRTVPGVPGNNDLAMSADGHVLSLIYDVDDGVVTTEQRDGGVWAPLTRRVTDGHYPHTPAVALSADGNTTAATWMGYGGCTGMCVDAAIATEPAPTPVVRVSGPDITGSARVGSVLTCAVGYTGQGWVRFRWRRDGAAIPGATTARYISVPADVTHRLTCATSAGNTATTLPEVASPTTTPITKGPRLAPRTAPRLKGNARVGRTLTVTNGSWQPGATSLTYRWYKDGKKIKHAHAGKLKLRQSLAGFKISARVIAKRAGYRHGVYETRTKQVRL